MRASFSNAHPVLATALHGMFMLSLAVWFSGPAHARTSASNPSAYSEQVGVIAMAQNNVAALPYTMGKQFSDLDSYLAHLKVMSTMDVPYYREVSPGRYKLESGRGTQNMAPVYATRQELMRKFGFSR